MAHKDDHLDEQGSLDVCNEVVETERSPCEENPTAEGCQGPGVSPPVLPDTEAVPFLAPYDTIRVGERELISTTRELNVFNRGLFYDGTSILDSNDVDLVRQTTRKLWAWDETEEFFMSPQVGVETAISDETFKSEPNQPKYWQGKLRITHGPDSNYSESDTTLAYLQQPRRRDDSGITIPNTVDTVFAAPQPFFESEMENVIAASFNTVSIKAEVGYYEEKPHVVETSLPSIYRAFYKMKTGQYPECDIDDTIQKFTSDSMVMMKEANQSIKRSFNQYVEIVINTKQGNKVSEFADEFQMDKYFLELVTSPYAENQEYAEVLDETRTVPAPPGQGSSRDEAFQNDRYYASAMEKTSPDPFYGLIKRIKNYPQEFFESFDHSQYPLKFEYYNNPEALRFTDIIRSQLFMNKVESQMINASKVRSLADIFAGEKAYSEVIGYKISKHNVEVVTDDLGNQTEEISPDPIQQFYFMDSNKVLDIEFVDTQVNAGKTYVYRIHSLNLVIGNSIYYENPVAKVDPDLGVSLRSIDLDFKTFPEIKIIEAPYFQKFVSVIEKPPLAPQVSFVPLKGRDDEMEILLTSNFGEEFRSPIKIFDSDQAIIDQMIESQPPRDPVLLEYQTDSLPVQFQIMRLETPPESYSDFSRSNFVKTLPTNGRSLMYKDEDFLPNKYYYYCFRAIDKIGISNPSQVYRVRVNSYVDGIYLDIKQYEMRPLVDTSFNLSIKRALKIQPAFNQRAISFPEGLNIDTPEFVTSAPDIFGQDFGIGNLEGEDSVWGKDFKIRLTSKQTGRKVDLNVSFSKVKHESLPPDSLINPDDATPQPCGTTELDIFLGNYGGVTANSDTPQVSLPPGYGSEIQVTNTRTFDNGLTLPPDDTPIDLPPELQLNASRESNNLYQQAQGLIVDPQPGFSEDSGLIITPTYESVAPDLAGGSSNGQGYLLFENTSPTPQTTTTSPVLQSSNSNIDLNRSANLNISARQRTSGPGGY